MLNVTVAITAILAGLLAARMVSPPQPELPPIERIDQGFDAAAGRPLQHYSVARKGDQIVPTPVQTLICTKQFCEPHPKNLENLPPHQRRGIP